MNWLSRLLGVEERRPSQAASLPIVVTSQSTVIGPSPDVEAPPRSVWDEKRWDSQTREGRRILSGSYRVRDQHRGRWREFLGQVVEHEGQGIAAYIADPPPEIRQHPHGACFQLIQPPWFRLHWNRAPRSVDDALLYMERMLDEAVNVYGR
jgi:hypothetical protein